MTNVDACENDREGCKQLNIEATRYLTATAGELGAHLIHLSTAFIFDGENGPYRAEDTPSPLSYYGQSKLESDQTVRESATTWTILPTLIVYVVLNDMTLSKIPI